MFHPRGPTLWELVAQGLSSTEHGYDLLAPKFDYTPFRTPETIITAALSCLGGAGALATALDMCCGTGAALWHLRPLCRERVVGIDFSQGMLDVARRSTDRAPGDAVIELVHGNVLYLPFRAAFDVAVCFGALGHILPQEQPRFVAQVARVLKPGGRFLFVTAPLPSRWSRQYWLARAFNAVLYLRNVLLSPPFTMYYLTFLLSDAVALLGRHGFSVHVHHGMFTGHFRHLRLVTGVLDQ
jgi:ubiquinone/menaquinone biosynthesis C-methylase UbiE